MLVSSTAAGLQNQKASESLGLTVNLDKTKVMIFRKRGPYCFRREKKSFFNGSKLKTVNSYKNLEYTL